MSWTVSIFLRILAIFKNFFGFGNKITNAEKYNAIIVGAGAAGITAAVKLQTSGFHNWVILEKLDEVGGTWAINKYPGLSCDIVSHVFSFSYFLNPNWSKLTSPRQEIQEYLYKIATSFRIFPRIRFNTEVLEVIWLENKWHVRLSTGEVLKANFLIGATGLYLFPSKPKIEGLDTFLGESVHTAEWSDEICLKDKSVAVIGTGATSVQLIPTIAPKVKNLFVYQRTPSWIMHRENYEYSTFMKLCFRFVPGFLKIYRWKHVLKREFMYQQAASYPGKDESGKEKFSSIYQDLKNELVNEAKSILKDPVLEAKLIPDYAILCKRIGVSDMYLQAFKRKNVHLITDRILSITETGIKTEPNDQKPSNPGAIKLDLIIFATGFDVMKSTVSPFKMQGRNGIDIIEAWKGYPKAMYGVTAPGFPNFFKIFGPNTATCHSSNWSIIESGVNYTVDCIRKTCAREAVFVEMKRDSMNGYYEWLKTKLDKVVHSSGCLSYYLNANGENFLLWPGTTLSYWWITLVCDLENYFLY